MLLTCLVPLLVIWGAGYMQFRHYASRMVLDQQERLVLNHAGFIESFMQARRMELLAVTDQYALQELLAGQLAHVFSVLQQGAGVYTDIGIIDDAGRHLKYIGPYNLANRNYAGADWFAKLKSQDLVISDLFMGYRAVPHFIIAVKRSTPTGYWILRATLNTDYVSQLVERIRVGSTGEAFLLDRRGLYQTKTQFASRLLSPSNLPFLAPHTGIETTELSDAGVTYLYSHAWTAGDRWLLVFRQDKAEAYAPLQRAFWTSALIALVGLVGVTLVALTISSRLVRYVKEADTQTDHLHSQLLATSKLAAVGEMAAGVAHEINNPLANIETLRTWILDLATAGPAAPEDIAEIVDSARKIGDQVERCRRITHDLLKFSRRVESERNSIDLNSLLDEMVQMIEHRARTENVTVEMRPGTLPNVVTSPSKLQQIVVNILNNAVDAMEGKGGTVQITTRAAGGGVQVDFKDTGCGISEENLAKIFQPFFTTKPVGRGTGLGLAVCYGLAQQLGGSLAVDSTLGVGTTFRLTLPIRPPDGERPVPGAVAVEPVTTAQ
jgi:two-component system NtrC family sensor kinase